VERPSRRILRFLQRRGVITLVTAPGEDARVARGVGRWRGWFRSPRRGRRRGHRRTGRDPGLDPDDRPVAKGHLCASAHGFNLQAATRVAANDKPGSERLCRYILRPPLANDRLHILPEVAVRLDFKKPWSDGDGRGEAAWGWGWVGRP